MTSTGLQARTVIDRLRARAHGDDTRYRQCAESYRAMANSLGFEGHMALAEAMD